MQTKSAASSLPSATPETRWMGVGHSALSGSAEATSEAIHQALSGRTPRLVLVFCSPAYDVPTVAATAQAMAGDEAVVAGCTTAGEICGQLALSQALVAVALGGEGFTVSSRVASLEAGPREAGRQVAQGLLELERPHKVLMLLSDGLIGLRSELIRGAYGVAGAAVPLVGGCAGDDLLLVKTFQFHAGEVISEGVVGIALGSIAPMAIGTGHGWQRISEPVVVTGSDGRWIHRLNDEPALDYFLHAVRAPAEAYKSGEALPYGGLEYMLGLLRPGGEEIRATVGADYATRSLLCSDVPEGTLVAIMQGSAEGTLNGTHEACQLVSQALGEHEPLGVIAFDCVARLVMLGQAGLMEELKIVTDAFPQAALGGFYTYGEFARARGSRGIHNATLALLVLT
ncbi:FIST signal transduction protein [Billgrantia kenyensis]|uniref:FIST C-terminal domain-containing protein n=1 Tax=Billgrantia kenyensis TaxID=321266 RepID=A0A7V9W0R8_9GAMM|nr:FIST N-terminal domain-containing protein [Halomonas kenyensis]MBA2778918.1 FIST C-terminal domain-containing protein [Halomonas kenyensis]MCG6662845.1 hypothetical protein [Halomonas kenyensis]